MIGEGGMGEAYPAQDPKSTRSMLPIALLKSLSNKMRQKL
jgi:hypothetical protein